MDDNLSKTVQSFKFEVPLEEEAEANKASWDIAKNINESTTFEQTLTMWRGFIPFRRRALEASKSEKTSRHTV